MKGEAVPTPEGWLCPFCYHRGVGDTGQFGCFWKEKVWETDSEQHVSTNVLRLWIALNMERKVYLFSPRGEGMHLCMNTKV